jgi:surface protein
VSVKGGKSKKKGTLSPSAEPTPDPCSWTGGPFSDCSIRIAVTEWLADKDAATTKYGPIASWDTSEVTNMESLFDDDYYDSTNFNEDLTYWDTSKVTTMRFMFYSCDVFNGDVSKWNVASVTDMQQMFAEASSFNADVSSWNVGSVTIMTSMFSYAYAFNGNVSLWDVASVTNMFGMFAGASSFGQTLCWNTFNADTTNMFTNTNGAQFDPAGYPDCLD